MGQQEQKSQIAQGARWLTLAAIFAIGFSLHASDVRDIREVREATKAAGSDCAELADSAARLSCFDELYAAEPTEQVAPARRRRAALVHNSSIKALRARDRQRMVFLLENGDVWMQTSPRNLPIKVGDTVSIKKGLFGGHILRTEHRVASRVHQLH